MSRINLPACGPRTHEGAPASPSRLTPIQQLRRTLLTCMLWEDNFYESGVSVADRIKALVPACRVEEVCALAVEARNAHHLRHVPLLILRELLRAKAGRIVGDTIAEVISRPDEITELVALYWQDAHAKHDATRRAMLPKQLRLGLSRAFRKFDEYQLAKYDRPDGVKLRDVMFMVHAKPKGSTRTGKGYRVASDLSPAEQLYAKVVDGTLATPDTWETRLSAGADKGQSFEALLRENKLGALALLRNLRNMEEAKVPVDVIVEALRKANFLKVLPFRFIAAYGKVSNPAIKGALDAAMLRGITSLPCLAGNTLVLVDVSGSMSGALAGKSEINRLDAACGLAILLRGVCDGVHVATFSNQVASVSGEEGMALQTAIYDSQPHCSTMMGAAITAMHTVHYDRLIVITDEQSHDVIPKAQLEGREYIINVAPYRNGVGYDKGYVKIDGFSEAVVAYIQALEAQDETA